MDTMLACPDCGTPNRAGADLCAQCWRALSDDVLSKIPAAAFAVAAPPPPAPPRAAPAPLTPPRTILAPQPVPAPEPVAPREAEPGPVPYFAPAGGCVAPSAGYSGSAGPVTTTTKSGAAPWGRLVALAMLLAVLGGGYYFFFGKSSAGFSPEDGAYSVTLPDGWERMPEIEEARSEIDVALKGSGEATSIVVGHAQIPANVGKEQLRAGVAMAQQFMPRFPGLSIGPVEDSTLIAGEGVTAYEMTATASSQLAPGGGKVRVVMVAQEGVPHLAFLMVACAQAECEKAEAAFQDVADTFEFSA